MEQQIFEIVICLNPNVSPSKTVQRNHCLRTLLTSTFHTKRGSVFNTGNIWADLYTGLNSWLWWILLDAQNKQQRKHQKIQQQNICTEIQLSVITAGTWTQNGPFKRRVLWPAKLLHRLTPCKRKSTSAAQSMGSLSLRLSVGLCDSTQTNK